MMTSKSERELWGIGGGWWWWYARGKMCIENGNSCGVACIVAAAAAVYKSTGMALAVIPAQIGKLCYTSLTVCFTQVNRGAAWTK